MYNVDNIQINKYYKFWKELMNEYECFIFKQIMEERCFIKIQILIIFYSLCMYSREFFYYF